MLYTSLWVQLAGPALDVGLLLRLDVNKVLEGVLCHAGLIITYNLDKQRQVNKYLKQGETFHRSKILTIKQTQTDISDKKIKQRKKTEKTD